MRGGLSHSLGRLDPIAQRLEIGKISLPIGPCRLGFLQSIQKKH